MQGIQFRILDVAMQSAFEIEGTDHVYSRVKARLGIIADAGYQPFPNLLLLHQKQLGLTSAELNVLANIMMHRHNMAVLPFPHTKTIAKRMDVAPQTIQRIIRELVKKGYLRKVKPRSRKETTSYDITPLLKVLEPYARERIALVGERSFDELPPKQLEELF